MNRPVPAVAFRFLCLAAALGNLLGSAALLLFHRPIFALLGAPPPADLFTFAGMSALSFAMGLGALAVFLRPERNVDLLLVGAAGKGLFALAAYAVFATRGLPLLWLAVGLHDLVFAAVFLLFATQLRSADLARLQRGDIVAGAPRAAGAPRGRALVIAYSLTGTGAGAVARLRRGLARGGYDVDVLRVTPLERVFRFPMSFSAFARIILRAAFRVPARIAPLGIPRDHGYDLVVVESQTWMLGMSAPVEAVFRDPRHLPIFEGRDVAALVVCRGAYRRTQAMLVRWLERAGGHVVGARAYVHRGREPRRLFTLWRYLIRGGRGPARRAYGLSDASLREIEIFGEDLARRPLLELVRAEVAQIPSSTFGAPGRLTAPSAPSPASDPAPPPRSGPEPRSGPISIPRMV